MMRPRTTVVSARSMTSGSLALARESRRHRVGAEQRLLAAPGRDRGRRIGEREADQAGLGDRQQVDAEHADVRAVADAGEGDAVAARALDDLLDRPLRRDVGQAVAVVDQAHAGALASPSPAAPRRRRGRCAACRSRTARATCRASAGPAPRREPGGAPPLRPCDHLRPARFSAVLASRNSVCAFFFTARILRSPWAR